MKKILICLLSAGIFSLTACSDDETNPNVPQPPVGSAALQPLTGGPGQPNSVYVDLSSGGMASAQRVSWDLGFYSGNEFRVVLNPSLKMSAKSLGTTNIDEVVAADDTMLIAQGQGNANQIDNPNGNITGTVIAEVSTNNAENKVYLINLGSGPGTTTPASGAENTVTGPHRGWKKVRILRNGSGYKIQYADINATTHQEVVVNKDGAFNFSFFSFTTNGTVAVEPAKTAWDIVFTTFVNLAPSPDGSFVPYSYPDYILTNTRGGAMSYQVMIADGVTYESFELTDVTASNFNTDQRNIGSNWRSTSIMGPGGFPVSQFVLKTDRFYVVKDAGGNLYKLRMTGGATESGERGFPAFQYELLD